MGEMQREQLAECRWRFSLSHCSNRNDRLALCVLSILLPKEEAHLQVYESISAWFVHNICNLLLRADFGYPRNISAAPCILARSGRRRRVSSLSPGAWEACIINNEPSPLPSNNIPRLEESSSVFLDSIFSPTSKQAPNNHNHVEKIRLKSKFDHVLLHAGDVAHQVSRRPSSPQKDVSIRSNMLSRPFLMQVLH